MSHRRCIIYAPGTKRLSKLMLKLDRGQIDYLVVEREAIWRRFGDFPAIVEREAQKARLKGRAPELTLVYSGPARRDEKDGIFVYKVNRPIVSYKRRFPDPGTTRPTTQEEPNP